MSDVQCPWLHMTDYSKSYRKYEELEYEIKQLTGKDLACLKALFAAGWTLTPPKRSTSMTEFAAMIDGDFEGP